MGKCHTCLFWRDGGVYAEGFDSDWGLCIRPTSIESNMIAICYAEDIDGELVTHKDFGCNEYKKISVKK